MSEGVRGSGSRREGGLGGRGSERSTARRFLRQFFVKTDRDDGAGPAPGGGGGAGTVCGVRRQHGATAGSALRAHQRRAEPSLEYQTVAKPSSHPRDPPHEILGRPNVYRLPARVQRAWWHVAGVSAVVFVSNPRFREYESISVKSSLFEFKISSSIRRRHHQTPLATPPTPPSCWCARG